MVDRIDADHAWMTIVEHFKNRAHLAEATAEVALDSLGDTLYFLADLHPGDRCLAIDEALNFYNQERPDKKVAPTGAADCRFVIHLPGETGCEKCSLPQSDGVGQPPP